MKIVYGIFRPVITSEYNDEGYDQAFGGMRLDPDRIYEKKEDAENEVALLLEVAQKEIATWSNEDCEQSLARQNSYINGFVDAASDDWGNYALPFVVELTVR